MLTIGYTEHIYDLLQRSHIYGIMIMIKFICEV